MLFLEFRTPRSEFQLNSCVLPFATLGFAGEMFLGTQLTVDGAFQLELGRSGKLTWELQSPTSNSPHPTSPIDPWPLVLQLSWQGISIQSAKCADGNR